MIATRLLSREGERDVWRIEALHQLPEQIPQGHLLWVNVHQATAQELAALKARFSLPDESVSRVMNTNGEQLLSEHEASVFVAMSVPTARNHKAEFVPLYCFFGKGWVVTVFPSLHESLEGVEKRIASRGLSPLSRTPSSDLVFFLFLDAAIGEYYPVAESIDEGLEKFDEDFVTTARKVTSTGELLEVTSAIGSVKKEITKMIESLSSTREIARTMSCGGVSLVADENLERFREAYAGSIQALRALDEVREKGRKVVETQTELFNASSDRIMKLLTVVATIFLPLALVAGVYGMNFTQGYFQPGTGTPLGFYALIAAMVVFSVGLLVYFKKSRWL